MDGFNSVLCSFANNDIDVGDFLLSLMNSKEQSASHLRNTLANRIGDVLSHLAKCELFEKPITDWSDAHVQSVYRLELKNLSSKRGGLHFNTKAAARNDMEQFNIKDMGSQMRNLAPRVWSVLGTLLSADEKLESRRERRWRKNEEKRSENARKRKHHQINSDNISCERDHGDERDGGAESDSDDSEITSDTSDEEIDDVVDGVHAAPASKRLSGNSRARREALINIVLIVSILAKSTNQNCNSLAVVLGFFLHSCNTPDRVIKVLAHAGVSISPSAIASTVSTLSIESAKHFKELAGTLKAAYMYDNFDVLFAHHNPTVEKGGSNLAHLTSGTLLRLEHLQSPSDLLASNFLWERSHFNLKRTIPLDFGENRSVFAALTNLHTPPGCRRSGLTARQAFQAWRFRHDLIHHGPEYFRKFKKELGEPEIIEQIPVVKTYQVPARAMDIDESKAKGNAQVLEELFRQGNIGDPNDTPGVVNVGDNILIVNGDLATGERIWSVLESRGIESTPFRRFQGVIFVPGNFHLLMAAADAVWRIILLPLDGRKDRCSAMEHVGILRPKETVKMGSKPGYRRMHDFIQYDGISIRLDAWRALTGYASLEDFANTKPDWDSLVNLSNKLVKEFVADGSLSRQRRRAENKRDEMMENMKIRHQLYLLFEELRHSMNSGDVGRLESCLPTWIFIFKSVGKNKYASYMTRFILDLHYVYPPGLRRCIRYNWLSNPTGKPNEFRGNDWVMEFNNLKTKAWRGGSYSNHTKENIIKESPMIETFFATHKTVERNFWLVNQTINHATPNLQKTIAAICDNLKNSDAQKFKPGRKVSYALPDKLAEGIDLSAIELDADIKTDFSSTEEELNTVEPEDLDI